MAEQGLPTTRNEIDGTAGTGDPRGIRNSDFMQFYTCGTHGLHMENERDFMQVYRRHM